METCEFTLPNKSDVRGWRIFCLGSAAVKESSGQEEKGSPGRQPTLSVLLAMDQLSVRAAFQALVTHVVDKGAMKELQKPLAGWVYALLSKLDKPIDDETASMMRALNRSLQAIRQEWVRKPRAFQFQISEN